MMSAHVAGIPCLIKYAIHGEYRPAKVDAPPEYCYEAEYPEVDFEVLDRRGNPAPWLERKLTSEDRDRIENECLEDEKERDSDY